MSQFDDDIKDIKNKLNAVSPSMCLAKWKQVTIHLQNGHNHSCHHPNTHQTPLEELKKNPSALHNTTFKKNLRKMMLKGQRPDECNYCWNIEDVGPDQISDRHLKSNDKWARPHYEEIKNAPWDDDVKPSYLEVSFSNLCNFKCAYCAPHISSKWMSEIKTLGPYPTDMKFNNIEMIERDRKMPIEDEEANPYVAAFWKWWPEIYTSLEVVRVTGGEPLLSPSTFKILDYVIQHPRPEMELAINSNLGVPEKVVDKLKEKIKLINSQGAVKKLTIFTSVDTWGTQAELIRTGLDLQLFERNFKSLLDEVPNLTLSIMCTYNMLSPLRFKDLLQWVLKMKSYEGARKNKSRVFLDISYLRDPQFLSIKLLPKEFAARLEEDLKTMQNNASEKIGWDIGFDEWEVTKLKRILEYFKADNVDPNWLRHHRIEFKKFMTEYQKRRDFDFTKEFPELSEFYKTLPEHH